METRCADHVTPLYPQKLALTSPTGGGGRSVGIVRVRIKATEFVCLFKVFVGFGNSVMTDRSDTFVLSNCHANLLIISV